MALLMRPCCTALLVTSAIFVVSLKIAQAISISDSHMDLRDQQGADNGLQLCLEFLSKNMPASDRNVVLDQDLVYTAVYALRARREHAWSRAVPLKIFLNNVLPYRHLDEPYEEWRKTFYAKVAPLVANTTSITEAAQVRKRSQQPEPGMSTLRCMLRHTYTCHGSD